MFIDASYFGYSMGAENIFPGNKLLNFSLIILLEFVGFTFTSIFLDKFGRRPALSACAIVSALFGIAIGITPIESPIKWLRIPFAVVAILLTALCSNGSYVYASELFLYLLIWKLKKLRSKWCVSKKFLEGLGLFVLDWCHSVLPV